MSGSWRSNRGRRGAIRVRRRDSLRAWIGNWLANRTVRRRWRRVGIGEWLIILAAVVVIGAFLLLLGKQGPVLAALVVLGLAAYLYYDLGAPGGR